MRNTVRRKQAAFWAVFLIGSALFFVVFLNATRKRQLGVPFYAPLLHVRSWLLWNAVPPLFFFEKLRSMRKVEVRLNLGLELLPAASNFPLLFVIVVQ